MHNPEYWNNTTVRQLERESIRSFVERQSGYLRGRVLDYGAGKPGTCHKPQPYRDLVQGDYFPYDKGDELPDGPFDAILCTQVLSHIEDPGGLMRDFFAWLVPGGHLVMTYPTSWDEVDVTELWRFTRWGAAWLIGAAGFRILTHERRAEIDLNGFKFPLGYGVLACK